MSISGSIRPEAITPLSTEQLEGVPDTYPFWDLSSAAIEQDKILFT